MSKFIRMLSLSLMIWLCFNVPVFATDLDIIDNMYIELQAKINNDIRATEFDCDDEITKGLTPFKEKREVVIDLTNDLSAVKKSCFEPITIFEEVIIRTYNLPKDDVIKSSTYEQRIVNTSRTYNGVTTTVNSTIGYYIMENVKIGGSICDAFCLTSSNINFSAPGYAHVVRVYAKHHQRGPDLNNNYRIVFDGNRYSAHRTDKNFSMYSSSGSANWSKSNSTYSALVKSSYSGGYVGTFYTVYFSWDLGGGQHGFDTLERANGFGSLPS